MQPEYNHPSQHFPPQVCPKKLIAKNHELITGWYIDIWNGCFKTMSLPPSQATCGDKSTTLNIRMPSNDKAAVCHTLGLDHLVQ